MQDKVFKLSGTDCSISTKISGDGDYHNCLMTDTVMDQGSGKHTISMKIADPTIEYAGIYCGVVRDGQACDKYPLSGGRDNTTGWLMGCASGSLWGNGKWNDEMAGQIKNGQVLTIKLDLDAGTLKFWVDSQSHGSRWTTGVIGPLRWAVSVSRTGAFVEIAPSPELLP